MNSQAPDGKRYKRPWLAVVLNLIPLIGLGGCVASTEEVAIDIGWDLIWFIFAWGLGYLYLGKLRQFFGALLLPWILCPLTIFVSPWDPEHQSPTIERIAPIMLIVSVACVLTAVHADRQAVAHNAGLQNPPPEDPKPDKKSAEKSEGM